jgi:S-adenosylmethionine:tRNA ribosyltransferase-isomerase
MRTDDFDYVLPEDLIAQAPVEPRDSSRLLLLDRTSDELQHRNFSNLPEYLESGDVMVFNDARVFPARLYGRKLRGGKPVGGKVEMLLLEQTTEDTWRAIGRPGRRLRKGATFKLDSLRNELVEVLQVADDGVRTVRFPVGLDLSAAGTVPLPPYIKLPLNNSERYQTVYARSEGSVAAPTAGLHFTENLLDNIRVLGVEAVFVTLHVGWDSFRPVTVDDPASHEMHSERYELSPGAAAALNRAKLEGRRVIVVGTTAARLLEANAVQKPNGQIYDRDVDDIGGKLTPGRGSTDLFIVPGYEFKIVDSMITNFHLPRSTLLMLVSAFAGREETMRVYQEALEHRYRFYSLGDAMMIL